MFPCQVLISDCSGFKTGTSTFRNTPTFYRTSSFDRPFSCSGNLQFLTTPGLFSGAWVPSPASGPARTSLPAAVGRSPVPGGVPGAEPSSQGPGEIHGENTIKSMVGKKTPQSQRKMRVMYTLICCVVFWYLQTPQFTYSSSDLLLQRHTSLHLQDVKSEFFTNGPRLALLPFLLRLQLPPLRRGRCGGGLLQQRQGRGGAGADGRQDHPQWGRSHWKIWKFLGNQMEINIENVWNESWFQVVFLNHGWFICVTCWFTIWNHGLSFYMFNGGRFEPQFLFLVRSNIKLVCGLCWISGFEPEVTLENWIQHLLKCRHWSFHYKLAWKPFLQGRPPMQSTNMNQLRSRY